MDGIERASEYADCFHLSGDEIGDERASALDSFVEIVVYDLKVELRRESELVFSSAKTLGYHLR